MPLGPSRHCGVSTATIRLPELAVQREFPLRRAANARLKTGIGHACIGRCRGPRSILGGMSVTAEGFAALCGTVCDLAAGSAGGRLALVLEGGYDLAGLADSVHACVSVLAGAPPPSPPAESSLIEAVIGQVRRIQRRYWPILNSGR